MRLICCVTSNIFGSMYKTLLSRLTNELMPPSVPFQTFAIYMDLGWAADTQHMKSSMHLRKADGVAECTSA